MYRGKYLTAPIEACIEITNRCNLNCEHCYASSGTNVDEKELTLEEIGRLLKELNEMGVFRIFISGGEPFMRKDFLNILRMIRSYPFGVVTSTNGVLVTEKLLKEIKKIGITGIQVSLDGSKATTHDKIRGVKGTFEKALETAKNISKLGISLTIGTVVSRRNYKEIPEIIDLALSLNASIFHLMDFQPMGRALHKFNKLRITDKQWVKLSNFIDKKKKELRGKMKIKAENNRFAMLATGKYSSEMFSKEFDDIDLCFMNCNAGVTKVVIAANGDVYPCEMLREDKFIVGNIRNTSFRHMWENSQVLNLLRNRNIKSIKGCEKCEFLDFCQGGCPGASYVFYKDILVADPRCSIAKR
jgi:radical SAM protein with 4Fe4S-binding SPASM domain